MGKIAGKSSAMLTYRTRTEVRVFARDARGKKRRIGNTPTQYTKRKKLELPHHERCGGKKAWLED
jgi:hypothetical protein